MSAPAAIQGDYCNLKFYPSRKVAMICIEIPLEAADAFVEAFGTPNPATGVPVALARIQNPLREALTASVEKERVPWDQLRPSQQSGIKCHEPIFWDFLNKEKGQRISSTQDAETAVRKICNVNTRAEFDRSEEKRANWFKLQDHFKTWELATR